MLYQYGINIDEVLAMHRGNNDYFYSQDGLGSVTELTDLGENVVESYSYETYGVPSFSSLVGNPYQFAGREYEPEHGLYFNRFRYYSPQMGRFLSEDPISFRGGVNLYNYTGNSPVGRVDPFGLEPFGGAQISLPITPGVPFIPTFPFPSIPTSPLSPSIPTGDPLDDFDCNGDPLCELAKELAKKARECALKPDECFESGDPNPDPSPGNPPPGDGDEPQDDPCESNPESCVCEESTPEMCVDPCIENPELCTCQESGSCSEPPSPEPPQCTEENPDMCTEPDPDSGGGGNQGDFPCGNSSGCPDDGTGGDGTDGGSTDGNGPGPGGWGDPHLITLDYFYYDFQGAGEFVFVRSLDDDLEIQTRMSPWRGSRVVSVMSAVTMNIAGDRVGVYVGRTPDLYVNGAPTALASNAISLPNGGRVEQDGTSVVVAWPDGSKVNVYNKGSYLNVIVWLADSRKGRVEGLLGNYDGSRVGELTARDGEVIPNISNYNQLYRVFGESWRISQEESLFDYIDGNTTETHTNRSFPSGLVSTGSLSPGVRQSAEQICRDAGISDPILLDACILDIGLTNDSSFAGIPAEVTAPEEALVLSQYALQLDGIDDYVEIPSNLKNLGITNEFTISVSIKADDVTGMRMLLEDGTQFDTSGFYLGVSPRDQEVFAGLNTMGASYFNDAIAAPAFADKWVNITYVYDGVAMQLYMDGVLFFSKDIAGDVISGNRNLRIGFPSGEQFFKGLVDELSIWNIALTEEEMRDILSRSLVGNEEGLVGYWAFDNGNGQVVNDASSNKNDGDPIGEPGWLDNGDATNRLSCNNILNAGNSAGDGEYSIDPDGSGGQGPMTVECNMSLAGGGWTKLTKMVSDSALNNDPDVTREYLYVKDGKWYQSPTSNLVWDWNSGKVLTGTYSYSGGGSFSCNSSGEVTLYGVSCSNGSGNQWKALIYYNVGKDPDNALVQLCQDRPGIFGSACQTGVTVFIREKNDIIFSEDFEDNSLDSRIDIQTLRVPPYPDSSSGAGIKPVKNLGSAYAYGFGRSSCAASCFSDYTSTLRIDLGKPTFVSTISFKYMELFGNWGSWGKIFLDGVPLSGGRDFQGTPSNGGQPDVTFTEGLYTVDSEATVIELRVEDITNSSEIFIDDLIIR